MSKYRLVFSPEFADDLDNVFEYISNSLADPHAAKRLMKRVDDSIVRVKDSPELYPLCDEPLKSLGFRKIVVDNYILIYTVNTRLCTVNFLRCFYARQDYLNMF